MKQALNMNVLLSSTDYKAALYCRVSREDKNTDTDFNANSESMSIQSQREMLITYAKEKGYEIADIYIDDGRTGTNFDRPDFQRMIKDIKIGKISMVITKDLSRLGRNYVETGQYRDCFFPEYNVRYIAINDGYDSKNEDNDIAPFKDILNEMYAKDISKKIKSSRKVAARQGKFMGSIPPYGYKRSETDKHQLVIDEEVAKIVKQIFTMYKNHESARYIADYLNQKGVLNPQAHYYQSVGKENPYKRNSKSWCSSTVISLMKNEVYIGHMVQSKRAVQSFKTKKRLELPPEMWVTVKETHKPIVDEETFKAVQLLMEQNKNKKPRKSNDEVSLFANILFCKDCNSKMVYSTMQRVSKLDCYYRCSTHVQHGKNTCASHRITLETLTDVILADIRNNARLAIADEEGFIKTLHSVSMKEKTQEIADCRKKEMLAKNRLIEIDELVQKTFEKNCNGLIPDSMLKSLLQKYEAEKQSLQERLEAIRIEILNAESQTTSIEKEVRNLMKYVEITELDRKTVTSLIQSIHVSEPVKVDGKKKFEIDIRYKFHNNSLSAKKETVLDNTISLKAV